MKILILCWTAVLLSSCEKKIQYKGNDGDPKIVIQCIAEVDSSFSFDIQKSRFFLTPESQATFLLNANVVLTNLTTGVTEVQNTMNVESKRYEFQMIAVQNNSYKVIVSALDLPTAEAECTVISKIPFFIIDTSCIPIENLKRAKVQFSDPSETNYYYFTVERQDSVQYGFQEISIKNENTQGGGLNQENQFGPSLLLLDLTFNGSEKIVNLDFYKGSSLSIERANLCNIDKNVYFYIESTLNVSSGFDLFSEPTTTYSNIKNGIGIFGSFAKSTLLIP